MGGPMAGHVARSGADLLVFNRTPEKTLPLLELGAKAADSLEQVGAECGQVFLCVRASEDVAACAGAIAQGYKSAGRSDGLLIADHSTILPEAAIELFQELRDQGIGFVDAPITGGSMGAQKGTLTVFCGGESGHIEAAMPTMKCYAKRAERVGGPGAGQTMKAANQIAVACSLLGLCEALAFAKNSGLDVAQTRELLSLGAAGSWAFENYGPKILNLDWSPGFTVDNQVKDLAYCEEAARGSGASVPGTELVHRLLRSMQGKGEGGLTTAALYLELLGQQEDR